jgi:hypothetical protein
MSGNALAQGLISETTVRQALTTARGDLFLASCYLAVTPRELDWYIRASEEMQGFVAAISKVKADANYDKLSVEQFSKQLEQLTRSYRVEAIDIIHDLAAMPFDTAAMAEVKLKAAVQLRGSHSDAPVNNDQASVLAELNALYQTSAPRIKTIRVAQIEFDDKS